MKNPLNPLLAKFKQIQWKPIWKKVEPVAKILVLAIPAIIVIYLGVNIYQSWKYTAEYSVDFKRANFKNQDLRLYVNEASTTPKILSTGIVNGVEYAEIGGTPLNFVLQPKEYPLNKTISFNTWLKGEGDWEISTVCNDCEKSKKYNWQPLYYGFLNDYSVAAQFGDTYIYSLDKKQYQQADNIDNWLKANLTNGASLEILDKVYDQTKLVAPVTGFREGSVTEIRQRMRGKHELYVYLKDKISLEVIKTDLNISDGADPVNISLYDMSGNLLGQANIEDDGIAIVDNDSFTPPIKKGFEQLVPSEGVYKLTFEPTDKAGSDWNIEYLKVNTNKLVFSGETLILDPITLYTVTKENKPINIYAWHSIAIQNISARSGTTEKKLSIGKKELGNTQKIDLTPGEWTLSVKGDQKIHGAIFALSKDNYFDPFIYDLNKSENPQIVIANYHFNLESTWTKVAGIFSELNFKGFKSLKNIYFALRNRSLDKKFSAEHDLRDQGYYPLAKYNDYVLWGRKNLNTYTAIADNLDAWLKAIVPAGSSLSLDESVYLDQKDFLNAQAPVGLNSSVTELDMALRGNHEFYVYADTPLTAEIAKEDLNDVNGEDVIDIKVEDVTGNLLCTSAIADDGMTTTSRATTTPLTGQISCPQATKGVYVLKIQERVPQFSSRQQDFVIRKIKINTNKIIIKDKAFNIGKIDFYTNNQNEVNLDYFYSKTGRDQMIEITGADAKNVKLTKKDEKKHVIKALPKGEKKIHPTEGNLIISGSNFALKAENWFDPSIINIGSSKTSDFMLLKDVYDRANYIRGINISIK
ncbi:MAG: hypothetical protein WC244_01605 [Patescibacteria group bacterium]|jgi:hypothetical protein